MPIISCFADLHKTHIVDSSAKTVGERVFALGWLILGTICAENRERSLHIFAQETIKLNVIGERRIHVSYLNLLRTLILKAIFV